MNLQQDHMHVQPIITFWPKTCAPFNRLDKLAQSSCGVESFVRS